LSASTIARQNLMVVENIPSVRAEIGAARSRGARIGLVPTMGALHEGHLSLMRAARRECDFVAVSIFVNPTQFGPNEDYLKYPRDLARDLAACDTAGVDLVFHPAVPTIYHDDFNTFVTVEGLSNVLEGACRPGHFRGVATVVLKLFNIVTPDVAFFGQKDYQQQTIIRRLCHDLNVPVDIRVCPTIREADGLALSSRNVYLNPEERRVALSLSRSLHLAQELVQAGQTDVPRIRQRMHELLTASPLVQVDYATLIHPESLDELVSVSGRCVAIVAARVGQTRLIDNLVIDP